jgi:ppGpp synthetase/RelA/SpoT-type nucleotidyltranferase
MDELREAYQREFRRYERLGEWVSELIKPALKEAHVYVPFVEARPKDVPGFLKKAFRKGYDDPMAEITDKSGVRVVVALKSDVAVVERIIDALFQVEERIDKEAELAPDTLGYLGVHFLVRPKAHTLQRDDLDLDGLICEIQIHTRAQNAWATVSHPLLYKPAGQAPPPPIARRVNRLVALVELFDNEVAEARRSVMAEPGYRQGAMLQPLEKEYFQFARADYDEDLSMNVLAVVAGAYTSDELERFPALIADFVQQNREYIAHIYANASPESAYPLLFQPEALAVLERLQNAKAMLRAVWDETLPSRALDRLSEELGRPA